MLERNCLVLLGVETPTGWRGNPLLEGVAESCHTGTDGLCGLRMQADRYGGIQALQAAVERLSKYLGTLEEKMDALERKKK